MYRFFIKTAFFFKQNFAKITAEKFYRGIEGAFHEKILFEHGRNMPCNRCFYLALRHTHQVF